LFNFGRTQEAVDVLYKAYEISPNKLEVVRSYGWYLRKNGDYELAERILLRALELNKNDIETLGMLGGLYKRMKQYEKSLKFYEKAIEISPNENYALLNLGLLYELNKNESRKENPYYEQIINQKINSKIENNELVWYHLARGEAYIAFGELSNSINEYNEAFKLNASNEVIESSTNNVEFLAQSKYAAISARKLLSSTLYPKIGKTLKDLDKLEIKGLIEPPPILLHLSDLHFGFIFDKNNYEETSSHRFSEGLYTKKMSTYISKQINDLEHERGTCNGLYLIISGDIVNQGKDNEYTNASQFFKEIIENTNLSKNNLVIVPGNHDINWNLSKENRSSRFDNYLKFLKNIYNDDLRKFYPYLNWDFKIDSERPLAEDLISIFHFEDSNLLIIGFNSCIYEDENHHFGIIGLKQLERVENYIKKIDKKMLKVAVLHHHVFPMEYKLEQNNGDILNDDSIVRDFSLVEEYFLRMGIDIVLHGHKHSPAIRETILHTEESNNRNLIICGSGSAGATKELLPKHIDNHFQIIRFLSYSRESKEDFVEIEWKEMKYKDLSNWKTLKNLIIKG